MALFSGSRTFAYDQTGALAFVELYVLTLGFHSGYFSLWMGQNNNLKILCNFCGLPFLERDCDVTFERVFHWTLFSITELRTLFHLKTRLLPLPQHLMIWCSLTLSDDLSLCWSRRFGMSSPKKHRKQETWKTKLTCISTYIIRKYTIYLFRSSYL